MVSLLRDAWVDQFVMHLSSLGVEVSRTVVVDLASEFWAFASNDDPRDAAELAWAEWSELDP